MITLDIIKNLTPPKCPYCQAQMTPNHNKVWNSKSYTYIAVVFVCNDERSTIPPHNFSIKARNLKELDEHQTLLDFS